MRNGKGQAVLVISSSFEPVSICHLRRALVLVVKGSALIQEDIGREVHRGIMWPSVIRLKSYRHIPHRIQILTRRNIFARDGYACQYCGVALSAAELTLDHVMPRSRGGGSTWQNLVSCCSACNKKKDNMTPEEAGMPLLRRPRPVSIHTARGLLRSHGEQEKMWQKYLYYDNEGSQKHVTVGPS